MGTFYKTQFVIKQNDCIYLSFNYFFILKSHQSGSDVRIFFGALDFRQSRRPAVAGRLSVVVVQLPVQVDQAGRRVVHLRVRCAGANRS